MGTTPNVLIIEKDSQEIELTMDLIGDVVRAQVDTTNSAARAIELVGRTNYQLVVADCTLAEMDGMTILERIKTASPTTSVILVSPVASIEEAVKAVKLGADEYFKKPFNIEHFKLAVRRCLDRRSLFTGDQEVTSLMYLLNTCQLVSGCLDEQKIFDTVNGYLLRETQAKGIALFKIEGETKEYIPTMSDLEPEVIQVLVDGSHLLESCIEEKVPMKVVARTKGELAIFLFKCVGEADYAVVCMEPQAGLSLEHLDSRCRLLRAQIEMTGKNIQNYQSVQHLLYLDEPTGLGNTRHLHLALDKVFAERKMGGGPKTFSVLFMDVDKFKSINDQYGHLIGTQLLYEVGAIIKQNLRANDLAFRYGGDEFIALLMDSNTKQAFDICERIRAQIESHKFLATKKMNLKLTVSVGVANCPEHANSKREVVEAADTAMYAVKRADRNKVFIAEKKAA